MFYQESIEKQYDKVFARIQEIARALSETTNRTSRNELCKEETDLRIQLQDLQELISENR